MTMTKKTRIMILIILLLLILFLFLIYWFVLRQSYADKINNKLNMESKNMINGYYSENGYFQPDDPFSIRPSINRLFTSESKLRITLPEKIEVYDNSNIIGYKKFRFEVVEFDKNTRKLKLISDYLYDVIIDNDTTFILIFYLFFEQKSEVESIKSIKDIKDIKDTDKAIIIKPNIFDKEIKNLLTITIEA